MPGGSPSVLYYNSNNNAIAFAFSHETCMACTFGWLGGRHENPFRTQAESSETWASCQNGTGLQCNASNQKTA